MPSRVKKLGRRGGLLLLLAVLWAGVAAQVAATHAPYDVDVAVLHERIPLAWRVGLWLASALIMAAANLIGSFIGTHMALRRGSGFVRRLFLGIVCLLIVKFAWDTFA